MSATHAPSRVRTRRRSVHPRNPLHANGAASPAGMLVGYAEIWRPVPGYWGKLYEVSNLGRVRSLDRITPAGRRVRGRIMKQTPDPCGCFPTVRLCERTRLGNGWWSGSWNQVEVERLRQAAFPEECSP